MPVLRVSLVLLCAWASAGCYVASLHGLADTSTSVIDERLLGHWGAADEGIVLEIARDEWRSYALTLTSATGEQRFTGRVFTVGDAQFFDLTIRSGTDVDVGVMPVHLLGRIRLTGETLAVDLLDHAWFSGRIGRGSLTTPAVRDDRDTILLTAPRQPLLRFLLAHASSAAMFDEVLTLTRDARLSRNATSRPGARGPGERP
jgi:hypothetical protein